MSYADQILANVWSFFVIFTCIVAGVNLLLILRAFIIRKKSQDQYSYDPLLPMVSIIIPMFNEEKTILATLEATTSQHYPNYQVVLVDDGSTDGTVSLLRSKFKFRGATSSDLNPRHEDAIVDALSIEIADGYGVQIVLITKDNGGKASALNLGFDLSADESEWILSVDGDTILNQDALHYLIHHRDVDADAVASMVGIANGNDMSEGAPANPKLPKKFWERVQWMEYNRSYVLLRNSLKDRNCVTVIPGACSFIKAEMIEQTGGYKENHLGEDMDHTLEIHEQGGKVQFLSKVLSWTEAPDNLKDLGTQRVRWFRGAWQSYTQHKRLLLDRYNKAFGLFLLPFIWIADLFGAWIELLGWVLAIYTIVTTSYDLTFFFILWVAIVGVHYLNWLLMLRFLKQMRLVDNYKPLYWIGAIEGFFHHYFYVYWVLKAHLLEWFGAKKKWNKLERKGF